MKLYQVLESQLKKDDFLKETRNGQKNIKIHTDAYLITAVPFYNYESENEFKNELESVLGI